MDPSKTEDWIDFYSLTLDRLAEFLADPQKRAAKLGITKEELAAQKEKLPGKMDMEKYRELCASWKNVARDLRLFGLALGDDLQLAPLMQDMNTKTWMEQPWLEVFRGNDKPLRFYGRDALTALGFFNFFIQHCDQVDPTDRIKKMLEAQNINKDNFREKMFGTAVRNPWEHEAPPDQKGQKP
jgi:hypothetical protein